MIEVAKLPNVTLQILPFAAGTHAGMDGTFVILEFEEEGDADVVFIDNATGGLFLEKAEELRKYISIFDTVGATALPPEASIEMIETLVEEPLWKSKRRVSDSI